MLLLSILSLSLPIFNIIINRFFNGLFLNGLRSVQESRTKGDIDFSRDGEMVTCGWEDGGVGSTAVTA